MAAAKPSRRERELLRHREDVLEAALEAFSEKGYHGASMQEIANDAEFSLSKVYSLFESKDDLYKCLVRSEAELFEKALHQALEVPGTPRERLMNFARVKGQIFRERIKMVAFYFREIYRSRLEMEPSADPDLKKTHLLFNRRIATVFQEGIDDGSFEEQNAYRAAALFNGMSNTFVTLWLDEPEQYPYEVGVEMIERVFFEGAQQSKPAESALG